MTIKFLFFVGLISSLGFAQDKTEVPTFKKRVLESTEVDFKNERLVVMIIFLNGEVIFVYNKITAFAARVANLYKPLLN